MHAVTTAAVRFPLLPLTLTRERLMAWAVPLALFGIALGARLWAAGQITFPANEGSALYVGVARNLVEGRGLVSDALWSYATPPLVLPKPAFELWMPLASLVAAAPMAFLGTTFAAAQLGSVLLGALVGPLTWLVAAEAARHAGLDPGRARMVALGSGVVAALLGPFLLAAAVPDSTTPFLVFGLAACVAMARTLERPSVGRGVLLGVLLGLAYLSRQEAVHLAAAFLLLAWPVIRDTGPGRRVGSAARLVGPVGLGGLAVVVPWLLRNVAAFGTLFPGQALENAYLATNEQIFAYAERPTLASLLAQGMPTILTHQLQALVHDLVSVLLVPALPIGAIGLISLLALRRSPAVARPTALRALLLSGLISYLVTSLVFPVATMWGTFQHAASPLLVGLIVATMLGVDGAVARLAHARSWPRANALLAPLGVLAIVMPFGLLQVSVVGRQATAQEARIDAVVAAIAPLAEVAELGSDHRAPARHAALISDHPVWLAEALRVVALPDESAVDVSRLGADFGTDLVVVLDERGRYPALWLRDSASACLAVPPPPLETPTVPAWLIRLQLGCGTP